jgi:hypothetical protein
MNEGATAAGACVPSAGFTGRGLGLEVVAGALPPDPRFRVAMVNAQTEGN